MNHIDKAVSLKQLTCLPEFQNSLPEFFDGSPFIFRFNDQIEFAVPAIFFLCPLLIGGMKKFTDVDHEVSFPILTVGVDNIKFNQSV
jgi:hypothetical protein